MKLGNDFTFNLRLIRKHLSFVALSVLVITLGITVSVFNFSLLQTMAFSQLPYENGDRFVIVATRNDQLSTSFREDTIDGYIYNRIAQNDVGLDGFYAVKIRGRAIIGDDSFVERVAAATVMPELLARTGVKPVYGRSLQPDDAEVGADPVAVISYGLWTNYFAGDENIIGKRVKINGSMHAVVGVMPEGYSFPMNNDLWLPMQMGGAVQPGDFSGITGVGILAPGMQIQTVSERVDTIMAGVKSEYPEYYGQLSSAVVNYTQILFGSSQAISVAMLVATLVILVLACINVGNLLFVRIRERIPEIAIRSALGASRLTLIRQVLIESFMISAISCVLSLPLAGYGIYLFEQKFKILLDLIGGMPFWMDFGINGAVVLCAVLVTVLVWLLSAFVPAWKVLGLDVYAVLSQNGSGVSNKNRNRVASIAVVSQLVFSFLLLIVCGTYIAYIRGAYDVDYGTETENFVIANVGLSEELYPEKSQREAYYARLEETLKGNSGIDDVTFTTALPGQSGKYRSFNLNDRDLRVNGSYPEQMVVWVDNDYFDMLGAELVEGRVFDATDTEDSLGVVILDQSFAQTMWSDESPLGKQIQLDPLGTNSDDGKPETLTVVGVVKHIVQSTPIGGFDKQTSFYRPISQHSPAALWVAARVNASMGNQYVNVFRQAASEVSNDVPLSSIATMTAMHEQGLAGASVVENGFVVAAFIALVLSSCGIYGMTSRSVVSRTAEIGLRRAIGLTDFGVIKMFLKKSVIYFAVGLVVGGGLGFMVSMGIASSTPGLAGFVTWVFAGVTLVIGLVITGATTIPVQAIVSKDPSQALYHQ